MSKDNGDHWSSCKTGTLPSLTLYCIQATDLFVSATLIQEDSSLLGLEPHVNHPQTHKTSLMQAKCPSHNISHDFQLTEGTVVFLQLSGEYNKPGHGKGEHTLTPFLFFFFPV